MRQNYNQDFSSVTIVFFLVGFYSYIIYPAWYLPAPPGIKFFYLNIVLILLMILTVILHLMLGRHPALTETDSGKKVTGRFERNGYIILSLICLCLHLFQINYPILTGLDSHLHAGLPAMLVHKINKLLSDNTGGFLNIHILFWIFLLSTLVFFSKGRQLQHRISAVVLKGKGLFIVAPVVIALSNLYAIALIRSGLLEKLGNIMLIHRYPAMGKTLFFAVYSLFGIQEWAGRILQIGFGLGAGFFLTKIAKFYDKDRLLSLGVYGLYIFFPPLLNILLLNHLTGGEVFFFIAIHYYFLRYLRNNSASDLGILTVMICLGFMYKRPILATVPMIWVSCLLAPLERKTSIFERVRIAIRSTAIPVAFISPYIFTDFWMDVSPKTFLGIEKLLNPPKNVLNLLIMPFAMTKPVFFLFLASLLYFISGLRKPLMRLISLWFLIYYAFCTLISAHIRNMMPLFSIAILMISICLFEFSRRIPEFGRLFFCSVCVMILILFIHHGLLREDTDFVTLTNKGYYLLPYDRAISHLGEKLNLGKRIYAPMLSEPSHFYLAKYGIADATYYRKIWAPMDGQTPDSLYEFCRENQFSYIMFPRPGPVRWIPYSGFYKKYSHLGLVYTGYTGGNWFLGQIKPDLVENLFEEKDTRFRKVQTFKRGYCEIGIFGI